MRTYFRLHRGVTLVELLVYMGMLAVVAVLTIPLFFATAENRMLQQTIALVELNGTQAVQTATMHIRDAERILHPLPGESASFLALQYADESRSPVIIGVDNGRMTIIEHASREMITSMQVAVQDFTVHNTSVSDAHPGVALTFRVSRTIRLEQPRTYERGFDVGVSLLPADIPAERSCVCDLPSCDDPSTVRWEVCQEVLSEMRCRYALTSLQCE